MEQFAERALSFRKVRPGWFHRGASGDLPDATMCEQASSEAAVETWIERGSTREQCSRGDHDQRHDGPKQVAVE